MKLILIRHGETEWNKQRRIRVPQRYPVEPEGLDEADRLAAALCRERIDAIYSSPMKRAAETAQIIADTCRIKVEVFHELREIDAGALDGLFERELTGSYETAWKELRSGNASARCPEGNHCRTFRRGPPGLSTACWRGTSMGQWWWSPTFWPTWSWFARPWAST